MSALIPTDHFGTITWLGRVPDRKAALASTPVRHMHLTYAGPDGESHGGLTRPSCSRVLGQYPRGTEIRNTRQLSVVSAQELAQIARAMELDCLDPALIGASVVIDGIADLTHLPPSARLQTESGATLVVDMENQACQLPARPIEAAHEGFGARFKSAATGRRGITAWVEREGTLSVGDRVRLHIPVQRGWQPGML
ncbi:MAG: MOSC domain-containing protein [Gemmobacter sp.]|nr:MOSC domain-containing protein [Gemmobacter sp.]